MTKKKRWLLNHPDYIIEYYKANREHLLELKYKRQNKNRMEFLMKNRLYRERKLYWLNLSKERPCMDCKGTFPPYVMHFDHRNPKEKFKSTSQMMTYSKERILKEVKKCDLVCANCHSIRTWGKS